MRGPWTQARRAGGTWRSSVPRVQAREQGSAMPFTESVLVEVGDCCHSESGSPQVRWRAREPCGHQPSAEASGPGLLLACAVQRCPPKDRVLGVQSPRHPKPPYLSELLPGIGPGPEMGLVLAKGDRHQRVATVIEYWPVGEESRGSGDMRNLWAHGYADTLQK